LNGFAIAGEATPFKNVPIAERFRFRASDDISQQLRPDGASDPPTGELFARNLGGSFVHWNGQSFRFQVVDFVYRTHIEQRYGKKFSLRRLRTTPARKPRFHRQLFAYVFLRMSD
jgi:hypothetical protein